MQQSAKDFRKWMKENYPDKALTTQQDRLIELIFGSFIFSAGRGSGKSFLIQLLAEYDKDRSDNG